MDVAGEGVSVYAEAKGEYTKQLCQYLVPALQQYFLDLLEEAKTKEPDTKKLLLKFQTLLEEISDWNVDKVQRETTALSMATHCDYLEELLTAVFIAHTKVLSAIRLSTRQKKLQITIPKLEHFLHRTMTECARILWSNTFLFSPSAPSMERQRNMRQIEKLLYDGVHQGIRGLLPVKNILREYLRDDPEEGDGEEEEEEEEEKVEDAPAAEAPAAAAAAAAAPGTEVATKEVEEAPALVPAAAPAAPAAVQAPPAPVEAPAAAPATPAFKGHDTQSSGAATPSGPIEDDAPEDEDIQILDGDNLPMDEFEDLEKPAAPAAAPEPKPAKKEEDDILPMDFEEL